MNYSIPQHNAFLRTITVTGSGKLEVTPNMAQIQFEVVTEGTNLNEVQEQNAKLTNQVIEALVAFGIQRSDIQTSLFQVTPRYDFIDGKQTFRGYEVRNAINVIVRNINRVGNVIDLAIKQGANQVSSLQFKVENEEGYYNKALQLAVQNGTEKAIQLGKEIGVVRLVPIEIVEQSTGGERLLKTSAFSTEMVTTPIEPGKISINAEIKMRFMY